jgi:DinB family protein
METSWKGIVWHQFDAAIDMLDDAILACPDDVWRDRSRQPEFWYVAYRALFFLDLYLSGSIDGFAPPAPFTLDALDQAALAPERPFTKHELQGYLQHGREKCRTTVCGLTDDRAADLCRFPWGEVRFAELLLFNMRHVQHHAAQLNLILRKTTDSAPEWVAQAQAFQRFRVEAATSG